MGFQGFMGWGRRGAMIALLLAALTVQAQVHKRFDLHGIRPGMLTREIILYSHAPIDTMLWGGADGGSMLSFKGEFLDDPGEFRIGIQGPDVTQITFVSKSRSAAENAKVLKKVIEKLRKLHGKPMQEYHNVYQIITWESPGEKFSVTTSDKGQFYSIALTNPEKQVAPTRAPIPPPELPHVKPAEQKQ